MDIVLLQEHWLYGYEKDEVNINLPQWKAIARAVDDKEPLPPTARVTGYGGTAILWKDELTALVQQVGEGNARILPLCLKLQNKDICIINCYLSSGNASESYFHFIEELAILQAIVEKYISTHSVILAGDLNADILNRNTRKEKALWKLIRRLNLKVANTPLAELHTFSHKSMIGVTSHIDYFITSQDLHAEINILQDVPANTSAHSPVCASLNISCNIPAPTNKKVTIIKKKIKWNEGNPDRYQSELAKRLEKTVSDTSTLEEYVTNLNNAIKEAEANSFPSTMSKQRSNKQKLLFPALADAISESKLAHHTWKQKGCPGKDHPLSIARRQASSKVRRVQRTHEAQRRSQLYTDILESHEKDQATFYKLLRRNHGQHAPQLALRINGSLSFDSDVQRTAWADFYEALATPDQAEQHKTLIDSLRWISRSSPAYFITPAHVSRAIKKLNTGKAPDLDGLQAEHFILGGETLAKAVATTVNMMISERHIPDLLKMGFKTPIPKKGKDQLELGNFRGITITPTLGKIVEHILQDIASPQLGGAISKLQYGFTKDNSPSMATLCLTEAAATAKDNKHDLYVATLDAQKAFDVVSHELLKLKLFHAGVNGNSWALIDDLYTGCKEVVRWKGQDSRPYNVNQGVRQGGVLSTTLYKEYINPFLLDLERSNTGLTIGHVFIGSPTCADDVLLLSDSSSQLQVMLNEAYSYSQSNCYKLHPSKSTVTHLVGNTTPMQLLLGEDPIEATTTFTHLGLDWCQGKLAPNIEERISLGRRTAYLLIGSGMHGTNGLNPVISSQVMTTQVLPRMTYGLEATTIQGKDYRLLNKAYKALLRQQQGLPERTATEAIYLLTGKFAAETYINYKTLLLFGAICRNGTGTPLYELCIRQLSQPDSSHSWFVHVRGLATSYDIDILSPLQHSWTKAAWKRHMKEAIFGRAYINLLHTAVSKSSLQWLDLQLCKQGVPHPVWKTSAYNLAETRKAAIRVKILTGTYIFEETLLKYGKSQDATCKICKEEPEDVSHFILRCQPLEPHRQGTIQEINKLLKEEDAHKHDPRRWVRTVLNGGVGGVLMNDECMMDFNRLCNRLIFNLHKHRDILINALLLPQ